PSSQPAPASAEFGVLARVRTSRSTNSRRNHEVAGESDGRWVPIEWRRVLLSIQARRNGAAPVSGASVSTRVPHWIDGAARLGEGRSAPVTNPATGQVTGQVPLASADEVDAVVASARAAFPAWRDASLAKRTEVLFAFRELLNSRKDELAAII